MTLYMIGLGLYDEKDITVRGLEAVKKCDYVYLENYTSVLGVPVKRLENFYNKKIILADRNLVEKKADEILDKAKDKKVAFLVVGDVFGATTHTDMALRAKEKGVNVEVIHNASILNAIGLTGLELYKFGRTASIPFPEEGFTPETPYEVIKQNHAHGLHTLCLLDIKVKEPSKDDLKRGKDRALPPRFMAINEGIKYLLELEVKRKEDVFTKNSLVLGCARLGGRDQKIVYGTAEQLKKIDFGGPLHCLVVTGNFHFMEEEAVQRFEI